MSAAVKSTSGRSSRVTVRASGRKAAEWSDSLKKRSVRVSPCATWDLRFVTHRHISEADIDKTLGAFAEAWKSK